MKKNSFNEGIYFIKKPSKLIKTMKLTVLLSLICLLPSIASVYSQEDIISLDIDNKAIKDVLREIERVSEYRFFFSDDLIPLDDRINLRVKNEKVKAVLDDLLLDKALSYQIVNNNLVLIIPNNIKQETIIKGKVTDMNNIPLPGVNIVEKGTTNGAVTNLDGEYTLSLNSPDAILSFSFIGYLTEEIELNGQTTLNVTLIEDIKTLEEVVVIGYGSQRKVNLTGAVGVVDSDELSSRPVQNTTQMLQGLIPGLNISQSQGGSLNTAPDINIRGVATIGEGSTGSPLVLIDGMEGNINALNPQDIESVSVLKDAAASSIYGSRAPFGVILITTKNGEIGKTVVNYNNSFRWNYPINIPDMMDSYTFATFFNEALINGGQTVHFSEAWMQQMKDYQNGILNESTYPDPRNTNIWANGYKFAYDNIDWYDAFYNDHTFAQEHNISASGGNKKMQFYFSGNFLDQDGLIKLSSDKFSRYSTTLKAKGQLTDWFSIEATNRFVREEYDRPSSLTNAFYRDLARQGWPTIPLYDPNGYYMSNWAINLTDGGRDKTQTDWLYQQIKFVLEPIINWKTHFDFNYRTRNEFRHYDVKKTYAHNVSGEPYYERDASHVYESPIRKNYLQANIYSEYKKQLGDHTIKGLLGFQAEEAKYRKITAQRDGIIVSYLPVLDLTSGTDPNGNTISPSVSGYKDSWSTSGFFGRINYNYKEKYLFETNLRYDGTSRYRDDMRWKWFPSASAGWNIAREDFWTSLENKISMMKLRASYGKLGNQNTSSIYPTYLTISTGTADGYWLINGAKPNTALAPGLISQSMTWEKINSWNFGADMALFNNRLNASYDHFVRKTLDMVGPAPELPDILGTSVPKANNTDLKTYGFELSISWQDRLKNGLGYSAKFLLSDSQTEITRYPNETGNLDTYRKGMKMGEIWGYETIGIAKSQEEMDMHLSSLSNGGQDAIGNNWEAGDVMYRDLNNDGKIDNGAKTEGDHGDLKIIGNNTPRYLFAIDLAANWKGFDIGALFQGIMKRDYAVNDSYYFWGAYKWGIWWSTGFEEHKDFFRDENSYSYELLGENKEAYYPRPVFSDKNQQVQTRYLQNAAYIRLKNLQVGYTLPKHLTSLIGIDQLRLFVSGENLWTGTKMTTIFDPESVGSGAEGDNNATGYRGNTYPLSRVFSIGINVNF